MSNYIPRYRSTARKKAPEPPKPQVRILSFIARILAIALVFLIIGGMWYASRWEALDVSDIRVQGSDELSSEVQDRADDYLDVRSGRLRNTRNIFLVPVSGLKNYLLQEFPRIATIEVTRSLEGVLTLVVVPREPVIALCDDDRCGMIGSDGILIEILAREQIQDVVILTGRTLVAPGEMQVSLRELAWFDTIQRMYESELGLIIQEIQLSLEKNGELLEVRVLISEGYYLRFDFETDVVFQGEVLRRVFTTELPLERRSEVEYIDLRVRNRAYYKLRSENEETQAATE